MNRHAEEARPRAYRMLSRLCLRGITPGDLPLLEDVPDLAPHLPDPFDLDEAAAEHQRLFDREVLPYASVFLEADGTLGGDVSAAVERRFRSAGLAVPTSEPPDHLGRELELLGALAGIRSGDGTTAGGPGGGPGAGEAGAEGGGGDDGAGYVEPAGGDEILDFMDGHLLWWLPSLVVALRRHADPFWGTVADLTLDLVLDHRSSLAGDAPPDHPAPWNLQGTPRDPLDDLTVDLREVATFLALPARSGLYLSEADARALGRSRRLPGGFGGRVRVLETVFHSAVAYDGIEEVAGGLQALVAAVRESLEAMVRGGLPPDFVEPWLGRLERTAGVVRRMARGEGPVS